MNKSQKNKIEWIHTGYDLFSSDGLEGLQVERIARVLGLNKSGFYHYFRNMDIFLKSLMELHHQNVDEMVIGMASIKKYDPDYIHFLVLNKQTVLFHMQLLRDRHIKLFWDTYTQVNDKINHGVMELWSAEIGLPKEVSEHFYNIMREIFYAKVTSKNLNFEFLHQIVCDGKLLIKEIQSNNLETKPKLRPVNLN
jgi:AcrR family transcriptional regulator